MGIPRDLDLVEGLPRSAWLDPQANLADLVDPAALAGLQRLGATVMSDLIALWTRTAGDYVVWIREALLAGDRQEVARVTHSLRGSSATIGALEIVRACRDITASIKAGGTPISVIEELPEAILRSSDALLGLLPAT